MTGLLDAYAGVVCDLDGVVYRGPTPVEHAVESLSAATVPVIYATNNASRPPQVVADHLRELGLDVTERDVLTSSQAGADHLARVLPAGSPVLAVGGPGVALALTEHGLVVVEPSDFGSGTVPVRGVLQGYGPSVTASDLAQAAYAVQSGAVWVATNTDATLPTHRGTAPGNGMMVAAVSRACGVDPIVVGKPEAPLYLVCAQRLGQPAGSLVAVGDRLDTDIAGAVAAGLDSVLVLTGVDTWQTAAQAPRALRPTYLVTDLRGLHEAYVEPVRDSDGWACGPHRCRIEGGTWVDNGAGSTIEVMRARVASLQEAIDAGLAAAAVAALVRSE